MIKGKKIKYLVFIGMVLAIVSSLFVSACAPAAPTGEGEAAAEIAALEAKIDDLEDDAAAGQAKAKKLQDEIDALKKPVKVQNWEPAGWEGSGPHWDQISFICDYINTASDGRIVATPSAPGAVCAAEEQLDAVAMGTTEAMLTYPGYHGGKIPLLKVHSTVGFAPKSVPEARYLLNSFEDGELREILREAYADYGDVHVVGVTWEVAGILLFSHVPIYGVADLDGLKFRGTEIVARAMDKFGASTVFIPGTELYTAIATGTVDCAHWGPAPSNVAMGFHEVAKYWIKKPPMVAEPCPVDFIVNGTVYQSLGDDLKAMIEAAMDASQIFWTANLEIEISKAWALVADQGVEVIEWSDEDCSAFSAAQLEQLSELLVDDYCNDYAAVTERFLKDMGRL